MANPEIRPIEAQTARRPTHCVGTDTHPRAAVDLENGGASIRHPDIRPVEADVLAGGPHRYRICPNHRGNKRANVNLRQARAGCYPEERTIEATSDGSE